MPKIEIDLKRLLAAGVHFGHYKRRWHPAVAPYVHSVRNGRCIIDLTLTKQALEEALPIVSDVVAAGKSVLFVGTKYQAKGIVKEAAESVGMPYVTHRWVGGMLTNYATIGIQIKKLKDLEKKMASGELASKYNKLEVQNYQHEIDGLNLLYGGVKEMGLLPGMVFVSDMQTNAIAVAEANKLGLPLVALADTNVDPRLATHPIPANDDALQSLQLLVDLVVKAVKDGQARVKPPGPVLAGANQKGEAGGER